jgi:hypothetical protein
MPPTAEDPASVHSIARAPSASKTKMVPPSSQGPTRSPSTPPLRPSARLEVRGLRNQRGPENRSDARAWRETLDPERPLAALRRLGRVRSVPGPALHACVHGGERASAERSGSMPFSSERRADGLPAPPTAVEAGAVCSAPGHLFYDSEPAEVDVRVQQDADAAPADLQYRHRGLLGHRRSRRDAAARAGWRSIPGRRASTACCSPRAGASRR